MSRTSPKNTSHIAQIIGAVWIAGWSAFKFCSDPNGIDISDVTFSGVAIAACFVPVYFNMIMDKVKEIKTTARKTDDIGGGK